MGVQSIIETLKKTEPFELLDSDSIANISSRAKITFYRAGSYIFKQDQASLNNLFVVVHGIVEISVRSDKGFETNIGQRKQNDLFGETVLLSRQQYTESARAKKDTTCIQIGSEVIEDLIYNNPGFGAFFNQLIAKRMRIFYNEIVNEHSYEAYSKIESPLFRKRVKDIMSSPVIYCYKDDQVTHVAKLMTAENISAIVVVNEKHVPVGLLTEKNMVKFLVAGQIFPVDDCRVEDIMNYNLITVGPDYLFNQALVAMIRNKVKHLAVVENGRLAGIVTMMDMVKTRSTGTLLLTHDIEEQETIFGLGQLSKSIDNILNAMVAEKAAVQEIFEVMSELHGRVTRRVIHLCEERMLREGWGPPPVDYCWLNMGSASRREQTLRTDQDNAMIYEDPIDRGIEEIDGYFERLAGYIVDGLIECGFERCNGGVMASNREWRKSLGEWITYIKKWTKSFDPDDVRKLTIFLDYSPVWGNTMLSDKLWKEIFAAFKDSNATSHLLTQDDLHFRLPVSFLGVINTEKSGPHKNEINLKTAACVHVINGVRIFAIQNEITEPSTFERLKILAQKGVLSEEDAEFISDSYETLMMFRIRENLKKVRQGKKADNYINPSRLSKREKTILKDAFYGVSRLQKLADNEFSIFWLKHLL